MQTGFGMRVCEGMGAGHKWKGFQRAHFVWLYVMPMSPLARCQCVHECVHGYLCVCVLILQPPTSIPSMSLSGIYIALPWIHREHKRIDDKQTVNVNENVNVVIVAAWLFQPTAIPLDQRYRKGDEICEQENGSCMIFSNRWNGIPNHGLKWGVSASVLQEFQHCKMKKKKEK